jgi:ATP-dependent RNA helicase MSS116
MGFRREVDDIISYLGPPAQRQTLLFSATVPPEVRSVMAKTMKSSFVSIDCIHDADASSHTNAQVQQSHVIVPGHTRLVTGTVEIISRIIQQNQGDLKMVVFFNTANLVAFYAELFNDALGIPVLELHSRKSQSFRTKTADKFRVEENAILFTSDVSARGVDYPGVTHVVQFGIADSRESYIHRLGRTGRAGKVGEGLLVLTDLERKFLSTLKGLDIPVNNEMQNMISGAPSAEILGKMEPIFTSIRTERNKSLAKSVRDAYRSMLGFYNGKLHKLGVPGNDALVEFVNSFSRQAGLTEIPELEMKTVKKMGLAQANGLNIVKNASRGGGLGGGSGGGGRNQSRGGAGDNGGSQGRGGRGPATSTGGRGPIGGRGPRASAEGMPARSGTTPQKRSSSTSGRGKSADTKKPRPETSQSGGGSSSQRNRRPNNGARGGAKAEAPN